MTFIEFIREVVTALKGLLEWYKSLMETHLELVLLTTILFGVAILLHLWGENPVVVDWLTKGAVLGAILMILTGRKSNDPPKE